jgi:hypothetical protein
MGEIIYGNQNFYLRMEVKNERKEYFNTVCSRWYWANSSLAFV